MVVLAVVLVSFDMFDDPLEWAFQQQGPAGIDKVKVAVFGVWQEGGIKEPKGLHVVADNDNGPRGYSVDFADDVG